MKKIVCILAATALLLGIFSTTAFAHGGHGGGHGGGGGGGGKTHTRHAACPVDGCNLTEPHEHDGTPYCGDWGWPGDYAVCPVEGCAATGLHAHDGVYYRCAHYETGHGCGERWRR